MNLQRVHPLDTPPYIVQPLCLQCLQHATQPVCLAHSRWQDVMAGRDYRAAATWTVSFGVRTADKAIIYLWLRSSWAERPAVALLQVGTPSITLLT